MTPLVSITDEQKLMMLLRAMIKDGVVLHDKGAYYVALCPFHDDGNPSLVVYKNNYRYRCMGCSASGDVFDYMMQRKGLSFGEASRELGIGSRRRPAMRLKSSLVELLLERERKGEDVFNKYGRDVVHGVLTAELKRRINGKQKGNNKIDRRRKGNGYPA